jgi:2-iminobutanoate/2-iminopropanoate deaminase
MAPISRDVIRTPSAPAPIGPYEQAIRAGGFLFLSGQVAIDPATGTFVPGDVAAQTRRALENLKAVLEAGGSSLAGVVRTGVYLADMSDFARMNEVYTEFFGDVRPARSTIAVKGLPAGAAVEIDAIAIAG